MPTSFWWWEWGNVSFITFLILKEFPIGECYNIEMHWFMCLLLSIAFKLGLLKKNQKISQKGGSSNELWHSAKTVYVTDAWKLRIDENVTADIEGFYEHSSVWVMITGKVSSRFRANKGLRIMCWMYCPHDCSCSTWEKSQYKWVRLGRVISESNTTCTRFTEFRVA